MTKIRPVSAAVVDKIVNYIQNNDLKVGEHLPSERLLAERLGETRGQIRTAIKHLEYNGMLNTIPQVGTIIKSQSPCVTTFQKILNSGSIDIRSLIEVRISLEVTAARLAAKRASPEDIGRIQAAQAEYERAAEAYISWHEENLRFHMQVIRASQNNAIVAIMENVLDDAVVYTRSRQSSYTRERLNNSIQEHQQIVEAIARHDEAEAAQVMAFHMRKMSDIAEKLSQILD